ncbi:hypothetical protein I302_106811 [Kwoniella bestiolae CBS 10118]|uniref:Uncharacterized protein n=1 Tax=Kwoniella bestiolae CBS 10118 TaxID=1296100 RepID=A0A1B9G0B5_9TREE|nr:hypothetical protein I302_05923 [Kwoniella bestiolae CBS 10118]OCF24463.1 hypothetical protein I302_05923 [Kwoniella bestiolae CBS 10118]
MNTQTTDDASAANEDSSAPVDGTDQRTDSLQEEDEDIPLIYSCDPDQRLPLLNFSSEVPTTPSGGRVRSFVCTSEGPVFLYRPLAPPPTWTEIDTRQRRSAGFETTSAVNELTSDKSQAKPKEIDWSRFDISSEKLREFGYDLQGQFVVIDQNARRTESLVQEVLESLDPREIGDAQWINHEIYGRINFGDRWRWKFQNVSQLTAPSDLS